MGATGAEHICQHRHLHPDAHSTDVQTRSHIAPSPSQTVSSRVDIMTPEKRTYVNDEWASNAQLAIVAGPLGLACS